jgi:hypothetical protein
VLNRVSRTHDEPAMPSAEPLAHLPTLQTLPLANCQRYDALLSGGGYVA